jgi:hypothetical protein
VFVFQFAVIVLAAHGADSLLGNLSGQRDPREEDWTWIAPVQKILTGFAALVWVIVLIQYSLGKVRDNPGDQMMIASLVALASCGAA